MSEVDERQVADFARQTTLRRLLFGAVAFGAALVAVIAALVLFGGMGRSAQRNRAGVAAAELRRTFDAHRERCPGLWRAVFAIDFTRVSEPQAWSTRARLSAGTLACAEVAAIARELPQRRDGK